MVLDTELIKLILLSTLRTFLQLSEWNSLSWNFNFKRNILDPTRLRVIAHNNAENWETWATHRKLEFDAGPEDAIKFA